MYWKQTLVIIFTSGTIIRNSSSRSSRGGRSVFQIDKRYPVGNSGEVPTVILKKDVTVEFNCSSYDPWLSCIWKAPFTTTPCPMFISGSSSQSEDCSDWKSTSNYQIRYELQNNLHVCSLHGKIGIDSNHPDEGKWNCRMESQPSEASIYQDDQQFFEVKLLKPATVFVDIHRGQKMEEDENIHKSAEAEIYDTEDVEITCTAENGIPEPNIQWFLNTRQIDFKANEFKNKFLIVDEDGPKEKSPGRFYHMQKMKYTASLRDNGKFIQCQAQQVDDENHVNQAFSDSSKFQLYIKAVPLPAPPVVTAAMIGSIVGVIIILILAFLLLAFAWHTRRWCFAVPVVVMSPEKQYNEEKPPMYSAGTLTYSEINERSRLLDHSEMQTDTFDGDDDPVTKVTKYQTHIIMVSDKLVDNPDSTKMIGQVDSVAQATANLMKSMANSEDDLKFKNRFLLAAKGLTDSVGMLIEASEHSAAHPNDDKSKVAAYNAMQDVKTNAAQSVNIVKTNFLLKELENAARAALTAAKQSIEVTEDTCAEDKDLLEECKAVAIVTKVLEERVESFAQNPSSAETQSYLMIAAKRFIEPTNRFIDGSKKALTSILDENLNMKMKETLNETEISLNTLEAHVDKSESSLVTLDTESAVELIRSLQSELKQIKEEAQNSQLKPHSGESTEKATSDLNKSAKSVRFAVDNCYNSAMDGQRDDLNKAAKDSVKELTDFKTAVRGFAASSSEKAKQEYIIDHGIAVMESAAILVSQAHKVLLNPANPNATQSLSLASSKVAKALNATLLSNPDMVVMASNKLTKSLADELEDFRAAINAFRVNPIPGQTREIVSNGLKQANKAVKDNVTDLVNAALRADRDMTNIATKETALSLEDYKNAAKDVATIINDQEIQNKIVSQAQQIIGRSGNLFLEAQNAVKTPGDTRAAERLHEAAQEIANNMKELEKTYIYGAPGQEQYVSALSIMKYATRELTNPTPSALGDKIESIAAVNFKLMTSTREIAHLAQDILTKSNTDPEKLDGLTPRLAQYFKNFASDINFVLEQTNDDKSGIETRELACALGQSITELIEHTCAQQIHPEESCMMAIASNAQNVAENSVKVLTSVNTVAKRAQVLDQITSSLSGIVNNLDTTIMFASAGTLNAEDGTEGFADHRENILKVAQVLVTDVQSLLAASSSTRGELIEAAEQSMTNISQLSEEVKAGASCLGSENQEAQVMLLNTVKDVCGSLVGLLMHAKNANGQELEHPAFVQVSDYSKGVIVNITNLLKSVKSFEDENTRGTRALESSIEVITQEIHEFDSLDNPKFIATPEDLIRANHAITQATSKAVFASNSGKQEDLLAAANIGRRAIADLLNNCKGAAYSCEDEEMKAQTLQHGHNLAVQYQNLLMQLLQSLTSPTSESKAELMNISRMIAQTATLMAQVAEKLKGSDWVDPEDPMLIAENELLSAAEAIEQAAKNLATLRPRNEMPGQKISYEDMTFDELIIDSAKSIANATSSLIKAASEAQRELVAQGKVQKQTVKGSEDGQWSEGLVSAAKLVASATHSLCEAANKLVQGEGGEEHLIAAAKQVSKSTAQLVFACSVKADAESSAMIGLKTASNAVRKATDALVNAAKGSIQQVPSPKVKVDRFKERIEAEARVIRLEKELREAKELEEEVKNKSQRTVSDIKKARDAEAVVLSLAKELEEARNYCLRLNEEQYSHQ